MTTIFNGSITDKIRLTFKIYDFDNDGYITPEDIRLVMSYMPFHRKVKLKNNKNEADSKLIDNLNKISDGMLQNGEGKNINFD